MAKHSLCTFTGNTVNAVRDYLNEYTGPDTRIVFSRDGAAFYITVEDGHGQGGTENDSHPCPGSPGC
jgi:hypothetical protein